MAQLSDIPRLRSELRAVTRKTSLTARREQFEEDKRKEWQAIVAGIENGSQDVATVALEQQLARTVYDLYLAGVTKKDLCKAYGTKDYGTINRLIDSAVPDERTEELTSRLEDNYTKKYGMNVWEITALRYDGFTGTILVYADDESYPMLVDGEMSDDFRGTKLHREIAGNENGKFTELWRSLAG